MQEFVNKMTPIDLSDKNGTYLIIAPHCDDELLACGGIIQHAIENNLEVRVIFLTNGDGFRWAAIRNFKRPYITAQKFKILGKIRQKEAIACAQCLGLKRDNIYFLGYPDGGLKYLWSENWCKCNPFTSRYTKANVNPYSLAYKVKQKYTGKDMIRDLEELMVELKPKKIFVPSSYDNHPDHWAAYNFIRYVLVKLKMEREIDNFPEINQYLIHWNRWPLTLGAGSDFLIPPLSLARVIGKWSSYLLTDRQKELKLASLRKYRTQINVMKKYLESFIKDNEIFISDIWQKLYMTKSVNTGQLQISSIKRNIVFYEPYRNSNKFRTKKGTDIRKLRLSLSKKHLSIELIFLNNYISRQKFKIRAIILAKNKKRVISRDFELIIPADNKKYVHINHYINSATCLKRENVNIKWGDKSIEVIIKNHGINYENHMFITAEIIRKGRIVNRVSWKDISVVNT